MLYRTPVEEATKYDVDEEETQEEEEEVTAGEAEHAMLQFQQFQSIKPSESISADKTRLCTRRIIAEDRRWTLSIVPSLADICIRHIADNFCC